MRQGSKAKHWVLSDCTLVSMDPSAINDGYTPIERAWIEIDNDRIVRLGTGAPPVGLAIISANGQLVTPGLIDCHTHAIFAGDRANEFEQRLNGVSYADIAAQGGGILSTVRATRQATQDTLIELATPRIKSLINDGVTAIEIKSGYGLTLDDEIKMLRAANAIADTLPITVTTTLLAAHIVPPEYADNADDYINHVCDTIIPKVANERLAQAIDVFCEHLAFSVPQMLSVFEAAQQHGLAIKAHAEQLSNSGSAYAAAYAGALSVDHVEYLTLDGVKALAETGTVATLLPGAFYFLKETQRPPIDLLRQHQVPMAIATDLNPGTSPCVSLTLMMNMACVMFGLTPKEALQGTTVHAAKALGWVDRGVIKVGNYADLAIWQHRDPASLSYQLGQHPLVARVVSGEWYTTNVCAKNTAIPAKSDSAS